MKVKYLSEKLDKYFDTEEELKEAEEKADKKLALVKAEKAERAEAAKKVEEKRSAYLEARKEFEDELELFCKKYGTYHRTYTSNDLKSYPSLLSWLFDDSFFPF